MNIERAHAIAAALKEEITSGQLVKQMQALASALENAANQPSAQNQQAVADARSTIRELLKGAPSNAFSPAWRDLLEEEFGVDHLVGSGLWGEIELAFTGNDLTFAAAKKRIDELSTSVESLRSQLGAMCTAFNWFEFGREELDPGQCEIGLLIPREAVDQRLQALAEEFEEFDFIVRTFSEIAEGKIESPEVRTISSSEFMVFLASHAPTAAALALAAERLITVYHKILSIKKLRAELKQEGVPDDKVVGIGEHASELMGAEIEKLVEEFFEKYTILKDKGRRNELKNRLRFALRKVANRIDRGFNLEVRIEPFATGEGASESENGQVDADLAQAQRVIAEAAHTLEFIKADGPPILTLEERDSGEEESKKQEIDKK